MNVPSRIRPWLLALLGGVSWGLCFGVEARTFLPWIALVPLLWLATQPAPAGKRAVLRGWLWGWAHGLVYWLVAMPWIAHTLAVFGGLPRPLSWLLVVLVALYLGSYHAAFVVCGQRIARHSPGLVLIALPAAWVAIEWLRGHLPPLAFPWNLAGYAWATTPGALPATAWIGTHGLSYLLLFANAGLVIALRRRAPATAAVGLLVPLLILPLAGRFSWSEHDDAGDDGRGELAIVQPAGSLSPDGGQGWEDYQRLLALSAAVCDRQTGGDRLLLWPESAAFPLAWERDLRLRSDVERLAGGGCAVLLNSPLSAPEGIYNGAVLVTAEGVVGRYAKRRLVPYGEYVPLADLMPFVGTLARIATPFRPGTEIGLMPWGRERLGLAICYEVTFPELIAEQTRAGATVLVTITNDGWYGDTTAPWQHFRAARFRAAENRRPLIRAALSGVSGLIDARGRVVARLGIGEVDVLRGRVRGGTVLSPYSRMPWLVPLLCALVTVFAIIARRRHLR